MYKNIFCWIALIGLQAPALAAFAQGMCADTPAAAIKSIRTESLSTLVPAGKGYRVTSVRWDPVLNQRWAMIARCDHPEWPGFSLRTSEASKASYRPLDTVQHEHFPDVPVVRAGDIVHLWRQEDMVRIEAVGVAEESGSLGKTIRVRLRRRNTDAQSTEKQFSGIVRGPSNVEMQP